MSNKYHKNLDFIIKKITQLGYEKLYWLFDSLAKHFEKLSKSHFKKKEKTIGAALQRASGYLAAVARELSTVLNKQREQK